MTVPSDFADDLASLWRLAEPPRTFTDALTRIARDNQQRLSECDHGVLFDEEAARGLNDAEVRRRWPRLQGPCPKGCGFCGIGYASAMHYIMGDW